MKGDNIIIKIVKIFFVTILSILVIVNVVIFAKSILFPKMVPSIFGYKPFIVLSGSMKGTFNYGDMIVVKDIDPKEIEIGDVISFRNSKDFVTTHRIVDKSKTNSKCYVTKGDNNNGNDLDEVCPKQVEGKYLYRIAGLGSVILFIHEPIGFIIMMAMIIILCIYIYFSGKPEED